MEMVKQNRTDIDILLSALLLCSVIIGGFHHWAFSANPEESKKAQNTASKKSENPLAKEKAITIVNAIQPYITSGSVEKLVAMIAGNVERAAIPIDIMLAVLKDLLNNKQQFLDSTARLEILFGAVTGYQDPNDQNAILDLLLDKDYKYLSEGKPVLYVAANSSYPQAIPALKKWENKTGKKTEGLEMGAMKYAVKEKNLEALQAMLNNGVVMTKETMGVLLNDAVRNNCQCSLIDFLLTQGADINYAVDGYTPLLHAVKNNYLDAVRLLVEKGADTNKFVNNGVGTPLQVAKETLDAFYKKPQNKIDEKAVTAKNNAIAIESYLIEHGAKD
jgi:hypothetical protein